MAVGVLRFTELESRSALRCRLPEWRRLLRGSVAGGNSVSKRVLAEPIHIGPLVPQAVRPLDMLKTLSGDSAHVFPGPKGDPMNWVQKACQKIMTNAKIDDGRHHDTRRVLQTNIAESRWR
jgi:hypothetical protein